MQPDPPEPDDPLTHDSPHTGLTPPPGIDAERWRAVIAQRAPDTALVAAIRFMLHEHDLSFRKLAQ